MMNLVSIRESINGKSLMKQGAIENAINNMETSVRPKESVPELKRIQEDNKGMNIDTTA